MSEMETLKGVSKETIAIIIIAVVMGMMFSIGYLVATQIEKGNCMDYYESYMERQCVCQENSVYQFEPIKIGK